MMDTQHVNGRSCARDRWSSSDCRILYEIDDSARRANIMRVKHRRDAYR
jgi:mRNA-degrading endonuclease RelE of RelBE toxin-antitoxin system